MERFERVRTVDSYQVIDHDAEGDDNVVAATPVTPEGKAAITGEVARLNALEGIS